MKCVVLLLSLLSVGRSAPVGNCDTLITPVNVSTEEILGKWIFVGGSFDLPGSHSLDSQLTSAWLNITTTAKSNVLNIVRTQAIPDCSSITYNVSFENSTMLMKEPFYLKKVYLPTGCSDCLLVYEQVIPGEDTFTNLLLFSRKKSVSPDVVETLKKQAECLRMPSPIMMNPNNEICPDNIPPTDLNDIKRAFEGIARLLEALAGLFAKINCDKAPCGNLERGVEPTHKMNS